MSTIGINPPPPIHVPDINEHERILQEAIDDLVRQIAEQFRPERIILFGSYAYGQPRPDSDVDLLVVMDTPQHWIDQGLEILNALDSDLAIDLLVRPPAVLNQRVALGDFFLREITQRGKVMYEQPNR